MPTIPVTLAHGESVVHYDVGGSGPGLLLLHGTAASRESWEPVLKPLREHFTVLTPDFSGAGLTTDHGGPVTVDDLAAQALAVIADAGLGAVHLAGHSLGAVVAAHVAGTAPQRVRSAVLVAAWVRTDARQEAEFRFWLDLLSRGPDAFARLLPLMAFGPGYWRGATSSSNEELVRELAGIIQPGAARHVETDIEVDLRPVLGAITAPVLVVGCAYDRLIDAAQQRELVARITGALYAELDTGHAGPAEDPEGFAECVLGFVGAKDS